MEAALDSESVCTQDDRKKEPKMAVKVRDFQGAWWIFIDHNGVRKAKRIGPGKLGKQAAERAKRELDARLVLGHPIMQAPRVRHSFADYSSVFLQRIEQSRKHTTYTDYRKIIDRDLLPHRATSVRGQSLQVHVSRRRQGLWVLTIHHAQQMLKPLYFVRFGLMLGQRC